MSESPLVLPTSVTKKKASDDEKPNEGEAPAATPKSVNQLEDGEPDFTQPGVHFPIVLFEDRIAIRRSDRAEMSRGGIVLPSSAQEKTMTGMVVGVGPGITKGDGSCVPMKVAIGDIAVFEKHRGMTEITCNKFKYHIMRASDLIGIVRSQDVELRTY